SKVFKTEDDTRPLPPPVVDDVDDLEDEEPLPRPRRVVNAPVSFDGDDSGAPGDDIAIKARLEPRSNALVLLLNRPLLRGLSFWAPDADTAYAHAPLAGALFDLGGVSSVLVHDTTLTVIRDGRDASPWEEFA